MIKYILFFDGFVGGILGREGYLIYIRDKREGLENIF